MLRGKNGIFLTWGLIIILHLGFAAYRFAEGPVYLGDSYEYLNQAHNIKTFGVVYSKDYSEAIDKQAYSTRPPGYPLLILFLKSLYDSDFTVLIIQNLLSIFNLWMLLRLIHGYIPGNEGNKILIPFILFYPAQLIYANLVMSEILLQTIILLIFSETLRLIKKPDTKTFGLISFLVITGMIVKPVLYLLWIPVMALGILLAIKQRRHMFILWGIIPLFFTVMYSKWNERRTGFYHFSSIREASLLNYTTNLLLQNVYGAETADSMIGSIKKEAALQPDFRTEQEFIIKSCKDVIVKHPFQYALLHTKGMINFILDPGRFDLYNYFGLEKESGGMLYYFSTEGYRGVWKYLREQSVSILLLLALILIFNILKAVSFLIFIFIKEVPLPVRLSVFFMVMYVCFLTGPSGASRFMLPLFPVLLFTLPFSWQEARKVFKSMGNKKFRNQLQ